MIKHITTLLKKMAEATAVAVGVAATTSIVAILSPLIFILGGSTVIELLTSRMGGREPEIKNIVRNIITFGGLVVGAVFGSVMVGLALDKLYPNDVCTKNDWEEEGRCHEMALGYTRMWVPLSSTMGATVAYVTSSKALSWVDKMMRKDEMAIANELLGGARPLAQSKER